MAMVVSMPNDFLDLWTSMVRMTPQGDFQDQRPKPRDHPYPLCFLPLGKESLQLLHRFAFSLMGYLNHSRNLSSSLVSKNWSSTAWDA
jgi:hypothetical protein